jgi:hypothetical protein
MIDKQLQLITKKDRDCYKSLDRHHNLRKEFDGPRGQSFQLWIGRGRMVLVEIEPDGEWNVWRLIDESNSVAETCEAVRRYLAGAP